MGVILVVAALIFIAAGMVAFLAGKPLNEAERKKLPGAVAQFNAQLTAEEKHVGGKHVAAFRIIGAVCVAVGLFAIWFALTALK